MLIVATVVLTLAAGLAVLMFVDANANPDLLWRDYFHDRNEHYALGQDLALAVRTADPAWFFAELLKQQVWPPVHGLVLAAVLLIGGIDHRLGIVPSLIGWALTILFVALLSKRGLRQRNLGMAASAVAVTLAISSPAFRLLACDVMLECLGAGLSAAALWAYDRAMVEMEPSADAREEARRWRMLATILTLLFFEKGNYWGLVVGALVLTHLASAAVTTRNMVATILGFMTEDRMRMLGRMLLDPLVAGAAVVLGLVVYLYVHGTIRITIFGRDVALPPENFVTIAYALLYARFGLFWLKSRVQIDAALGAAGRSVFYWHLTPIAVSFLLPRRLSAFVWFVGPSNAGTGFDALDGLTVYWRAFVEGFSATPTAAILTLALFAIGLSQVRRLSAGGRAAFALALVGFVGVVLHPQHQGRFLASWIFAVWVGAGIGSAFVLERLVPKRAVLPVACSVVLALAAAFWRAAPASAYPVAIYPDGGPSDLDLFRPALPELDGLRSIAYATTFGESSLLTWMMRERCRCQMVVEKPWIDLISRDSVRALMANRLAFSQAPVFVIAATPSGRYQNAAGIGILDALANQDRYSRVAVYPVPDFGGQVELWRLQSVARHPAIGR
jgi:hypothetical protein